MKPNRQKVYDKFKGHCAYCGQSIQIKDMQIDHIIPQRLLLCKPPEATIDQVDCENNLVPTCRSCNNYKSGNPIESFRKSLENQIDVLRRDRPTFRLAERYGLINCTPKPIKFYFEQIRDNG